MAPNSQLPVLSRYTVGEPDEREPQLPTPNFSILDRNLGILITNQSQPKHDRVWQR
ncbi:hypothetical protein [Chamaesiphon sp. VAR_69_metabat_338]|uniref:hypothetical protein n=1 Tax=Chamaesiphon sp. VAR_69_metabat_338 TaxID=2964704 RepID=UPI00286E1E96|nr:hypothetical protein [Chamaesiphon sp. VAR_69_metabat_338]